MRGAMQVDEILRFAGLREQERSARKAGESTEIETGRGTSEIEIVSVS